MINMAAARRRVFSRQAMGSAGRWLLATALLCSVGTSRQCAESWSELSKSSGPASGGFSIILSGACLRNGTGINRVVFSCAETGESVEVNATLSETDLHNASKVAFVAPAWKYAGCDTQVSLQAWAIPVWAGSADLSDAIPSHETVLTPRPPMQNAEGGLVPFIGDVANSTLNFVAGWIAVDQSAGLLAGGTILSVQAFGLDPSALYHCIFTGTSALLRKNATVPATRVSSTKIVCEAPAWPAWPTPAEASITIAKNGRSLPLQAVGDVRIRFTAEGWASASPKKVYAYGGTTLTVLGVGFSTAAVLAPPANP